MWNVPSATSQYALTWWKSTDKLLLVLQREEFENYWDSIFNRHRTGKVTPPLLCWHLPSSDKHSPICNPFTEIKLHTPRAFGSSDEDYHRLLNISVNAPFWHTSCLCSGLQCQTWQLKKFYNGSKMPISVFFLVAWQMWKLGNTINNCIPVFSTPIS